MLLNCYILIICFFSLRLQIYTYIYVTKLFRKRFLVFFSRDYNIFLPNTSLRQNLIHWHAFVIHFILAFIFALSLGV